MRTDKLPENLKLKEQLSCMLLDPTQHKYKVGVIYIVYKTIERNPNIPFAQLPILLETTLNIKPDVVESAVTSLISILRAVKRWHYPQSEIMHLRARGFNEEFEKWLATTLSENPELSVFEAPVLKKKHWRHRECQSQEDLFTGLEEIAA